VIFLADVQKRQTAVKVSIGSLLNGTYVKQEGMLPNYVLLGDNSKVSRVNVVGVVVGIGEDTGYQSVFVDDGSGKLSVRAFEQMESLSSLDIGDCVLVIGRPREFSDEIYVLPEIIRKIENKQWLEVRKLELKRNSLREPGVNHELPVSSSPSIPEPSSVVEEEFVESGSADVCKLIKDLDSGSGADFDEVIKRSSNDNAEKLVLSLMKSGDVFEVSPGKLKVLE